MARKRQDEAPTKPDDIVNSEANIQKTDKNSQKGKKFPGKTLPSAKTYSDSANDYVLYTENVSGTVEELANCVLNNPVLVAQLKSLGFESKNPAGMTFKEAMICSQIANAIRGDLKSYQAVMEYSKKEARMPLKEFVNGGGKIPLSMYDEE